MTPQRRSVVLACDSTEGEPFAAWLRAQGHAASVGRDTGNHVDGVWTSTDEEASAWLTAAWGAYCSTSTITAG